VLNTIPGGQFQSRLNANIREQKGYSYDVLVVLGLPDDYYQQYAKNVSAMTKDDVLRVAKRYIDLNHLAIVIVGNRSEVEDR